MQKKQNRPTSLGGHSEKTLSHSSKRGSTGTLDGFDQSLAYGDKVFLLQNVAVPEES